MLPAGGREQPEVNDRKLIDGTIITILKEQSSLYFSTQYNSTEADYSMITINVEIETQWNEIMVHFTSRI